MRPDEISRLQELEEEIVQLNKRLEALESGEGRRPRGPKAARAMTEKDAWDVKFGALKGKNHKEAAEALGLSYGQLFSCRGGYTFKHVRSDWLEKQQKGDAK